MGVPTGGNVGNAQGSVTISTAQLASALASVRTFATDFERAFAGVSVATNKAQSGISSLMGTLNRLAGGFGLQLGVAGVVQLGRFTAELAKSSAMAARTEDQYEVLAAGVGQSADMMLESMQKASKGMISDHELILGANKAMLLGVAKNSQELNQLLNASRVLGQAMGQDTSKSFNDLVIGLGRLSPLILDNLGIANEGEQMFENYARSVGKTADELTKAEKRQILLNKVMAAAQPLLDKEAQSGDNAANKFERLGAAWGNTTETAGDLFNEIGLTSLALNGLAGVLEFVNNKWEQSLIVLEGVKAAYEDLRGFLGFGGGAAGVSGTAPWGTRGAPPAGVAAAVADPRIAQAELDWAEGVQDINDRLHDDIIDAERSYGRARQSAIEQYQLGVSREQQDFALQRQRQEQELADSILRINRDAARREQRMAEDLARGIARAEADSAERVANARRDHDRRLAEMDEDFKRNQERREEDFRDDMLSAAGRLDAIALLELRKGRARELSDAKEAHAEQRADLDEQLQERLDDEADSLDKSIRQQREAYDRQLQDAREADAQRLEDMRADHAKRQEQEQIDRGIRLSRQAEDHANQLRQMDAEHASRLAQIHIHAQDERDDLDREHKQAMIDLKVQNDEWLKELERMEKARRKIYDEAWGVNRSRGHPSEADPYMNPPAYATGGYVPRTGLALLHRGETVLPASQPWGMGGGSRGPISIGEISISIAGTTDMGPGELRPMIYEVLVDALEQVAGRR